MLSYPDQNRMVSSVPIRMLSKALTAPSAIPTFRHRAWLDWPLSILRHPLFFLSQQLSSFHKFALSISWRSRWERKHNCLLDFEWIQVFQALFEIENYGEDRNGSKMMWISVRNEHSKDLLPKFCGDSNRLDFFSHLNIFPKRKTRKNKNFSIFQHNRGGFNHPLNKFIHI